jgi:hypothetical protein
MPLTNEDNFMEKICRLFMHQILALKLDFGKHLQGTSFI